MPRYLLDRTVSAIAYRLPRRVLYWAVVAAHGRATTDRWSGTACPADAGTILNHLSAGTTIGEAGRAPR